MMKNIAQDSDAVAALTLSMLMPDLEAGSMALLPLVLPMLNTEFGIVRQARRTLAPLGELFVRTMLEVDAEVTALEENAAKVLFANHRRTPTKRPQVSPNSAVRRA